MDEEDREVTIEDIAEAVKLLGRNIDRAAALVNSFKKLSCDQVGGHRQEGCSVRDIVDDVVASMKHEWKTKRGMTLTVLAESDHLDGEELKWDGYPGHLSQVLINFMQNTLRYAYPDGQTNGKIEIVLGEERHACEGWNITFTDYGCGMSPEIQRKVFDPFFTTGRALGGTGLGMAIVQNLVVNKMQGSIHVKSELGKGTSITVWIPKILAP